MRVFSGIRRDWFETWRSLLFVSTRTGWWGERLQQVELNLNSTSRTLLSWMEIKDASNVKKLLESWFKMLYLACFRTQGIALHLWITFLVVKKGFQKARIEKRAIQTWHGLNHRAISPNFSSDWRTTDHTSSPHHAPAIKQLTLSSPCQSCIELQTG